MESVYLNSRTYLMVNLLIFVQNLNFKKIINFLGDPNLEKFSNDFINDNSELFLGEILPQLEDNLAEIFTNTANEIVGNAPFDEMFPEALSS